MQATDSVRSLATDNYNAAAKKFVTREFEASLLLLEPLARKSRELVERDQISKSTRAKIWVLYSILHESGKTSAPFSWEFLLEGYTGLAEVESEVVLAAAKAITQTSTKPSAVRETAEKIEEYISLKPALEASDMLLVTFLARTVLPRLGDYEYAREFTSQCSLFGDHQRDQLLSQIDLMEQQALEAVVKQQQLEESLLKEEKERVQRAIEAQRQELEQLGKPAAELEVREMPKRRQIARDRKTLSANLREYIVATVKSRGLQNGILFILLLLALASNYQVRRKFSAGGKWVWECAKKAVKMGMTVTYF